MRLPDEPWAKEWRVTALEAVISLLRLGIDSPTMEFATADFLRFAYACGAEDSSGELCAVIPPLGSILLSSDPVEPRRKFTQIRIGHGFHIHGVLFTRRPR